MSETKTAIHPTYLDHLKHMLGVSEQRSRRLCGFRNHFCTEIGSAHYRDMCEMESLGFVEAGQVINDGCDRYFHATRAGANACNLTKKVMVELFGKESR